MRKDCSKPSTISPFRIEGCIHGEIVILVGGWEEAIGVFTSKCLIFRRNEVVFESASLLETESLRG